MPGQRKPKYELQAPKYRAAWEQKSLPDATSQVWERFHFREVSMDPSPQLGFDPPTEIVEEVEKLTREYSGKVAESGRRPSGAAS